MKGIAHARIEVDPTKTLPLNVHDHAIPSERFGKRIWLWLAVSGPILWVIHAIILGIGFILGEHFNFPAFLTAIFYGWLCMQSTSDVYNSISTIIQNRNTLLGYLYAIALSVGNVGFWILAFETSYGPLAMLLMIAAGLLTGRLTELQMRKRVYSEKHRMYLSKMKERTFPLECVTAVIQSVKEGELSVLKTLPGRYEESCCRVRIHYSCNSSEGILNVEVEQEQRVEFAGMTFVMPMTKRRVVYSTLIEPQNTDTSDYETRALQVMKGSA